MLVNAHISEYVRSLAQDCDIDSTCVFISDKTTPNTQLYYLGNFGVSEEILSRYHQHSIYDSDPFIDVLLHENHAIDAERRFHAAGDPFLAKCGTRASDYWRFVASQDIEVVGAATLRLQPRLYLAIGVHRDQRRRGRASVAVERLASGIDVLQNKIAANLLSSLLAGGKGYKSLLNAVNPGAANDHCKVSDLSPRETEVARLVCEGKQNKEIAWLASMSECTVENHLRRIYQKLGIHNRAALVARMNGVLN